MKLYTVCYYDENAPEGAPMKVIGTVTKLIKGDEHPYLLGHKLKIVAVLRKVADPDSEGDDYYLTDDEHLARLGGLAAADRVEVTPWLEAGRWSFVTSDPRAVDLECFAAIRG